MDTMLLDPDTWDIALDASGNIALARSRYPSEPRKGAAYSQAQDAASAIRLFQGELTYDVDQGVPYFQEILGKPPSVQIMKARFVQAALRVPGIIAAQCFIATFDSRTVTGQVQILNSDGNAAAANF